MKLWSTSIVDCGTPAGRTDHYARYIYYGEKGAKWCTAQKIRSLMGWLRLGAFGAWSTWTWLGRQQREDGRVNRAEQLLPSQTVSEIVNLSNSNAFQQRGKLTIPMLHICRSRERQLIYFDLKIKVKNIIIWILLFLYELKEFRLCIFLTLCSPRSYVGLFYYLVIVKIWGHCTVSSTRVITIGMALKSQRQCENRHTPISQIDLVVSKLEACWRN